MTSGMTRRVEQRVRERLALLFHDLPDAYAAVESLDHRHVGRLAGLLTKAAISDEDIGTDKFDGLTIDQTRAMASKVVLEAFRVSACTSTREERRILQFFSASKDVDDLFVGMPHWRRVLSNFHPLPRAPDTVIVGRPNQEQCLNGVLLDGRFFPTVEHYFQAAKYVLARAPEDLTAAFEIGGAVGDNPADAKKRGGRKAFAEAGYILDVKARTLTQCMPRRAAPHRDASTETHAHERTHACTRARTQICRRGTSYRTVSCGPACAQGWWAATASSGRRYLRPCRRTSTCCTSSAAARAATGGAPSASRRAGR